MICSKKNAFFDFFDFCIEGSPLWIDFGKICRRENFWNFQKKFQKWPVQDSSNIARNKLIKNQPVWGTHRWVANDKPPKGGVSHPPPCKIGLILKSFVTKVLSSRKFVQKVKVLISSTLEYEISVPSGINVSPGINIKNNKHTPWKIEAYCSNIE